MSYKLFPGEASGVSEPLGQPSPMQDGLEGLSVGQNIYFGKSAVRDQSPVLCKDSLPFASLKSAKKRGQSRLQ